MIRVKMTFAIAALSLIVFIPVGFLVLMTERANRVQDHLELQYLSLIGFIELGATVDETFMAARHHFFQLEGDHVYDQRLAKRDIEARLQNIENNVLEKAEFLRWSDSQIESEKAIINALREELRTSFSELDMAFHEVSEQKLTEAYDRARFVFDVRMARMFEDRITAKINSDRDRLERTRREIRSFSTIATTATIIISVCTIGITLWEISRLFWTVQRGIDTLSRGAQRVAAGELDHRIALDQKNELGKLARMFNDMTGEFQKSQEALRAAGNELEDKVEQRTKALNEANVELKERDDSRRQFFADIGHELRTPVTAIRGQAEVALRSKEQPLENRTLALQKIISLADQLSLDVSALFFIAREQAGVIDLRREAVDLDHVVGKVVGNMSAYLEKQRATVRLRKTDGIEYLVEGTESRLTQLLTILMTNAVVHSQPGVTIRIDLSIVGQRVGLAVSDDGPGIPSAERKRVFERFYRMDNQFAGSMTSTGLGLPIARSLVHAHGGMIRIDESDWGGTEIHVSFPRYQENAE